MISSSTCPRTIWGGGGTDVSTDGNDILISSIVENNMPEGADPLAFKIGLNSASPVYNWFINANNEVFYELVGEFLELNGSSVETRTLAQNVINSRYVHTCVSPFPFVKYPTGSNYHILYPNLTILLKEYLPYLSQNNRLIETIHNLTGLPNEDIINDLQWGNGPEINIAQLGTDQNGNLYYGKFNTQETERIYLDIDFVNQLETISNISKPNQSQMEQMAIFNSMLIFSICLHEYVHYADYAFDGEMSDNENTELGL